MVDSSNYDYLEFEKDKSIKSILKDEKILFSDKIIKINRYNMSQDRQLVITNKAIYNFKKKEMKRKILLSVILGISISKLTDEFVIHGQEAEYDYDFVSSKRNKIIEIIAKSFKEEIGKDLTLVLLEDKSLKNVVTLKPEKKKNEKFTRMPMDKEKHITLEKFLYGHRESKIIKEVVLTKDSNVKFEDFNIISVVGRGSFGKVCLVEYKHTGELYAMKSIKKDILIESEQIQNTLLEKKILQTIKHPFLCSLAFCFQTEDRVYFIMNFLRGGELFQHLKNSKVFEEKRVKFYAAQIGLALQYLHEKGIIYRDLKPENILLDEDGYLQLADFGMAKSLKNDEKAMSFCGTPEYLAPEIISSEGHDYLVDWWSFGILM